MCAGCPPAPSEFRNLNAPLFTLTLKADALPAPDSFPGIEELLVESRTIKDGLLTGATMLTRVMPFVAGS